MRNTLYIYLASLLMNALFFVYSGGRYPPLFRRRFLVPRRKTGTERRH